MKRFLLLGLILLVYMGGFATVQAGNNGDQIIVGDNYEITLPSEFKTIDIWEFIENYYNKKMSVIDFFRENPDIVQKYFEANPDEANEELDGSDIESYVSDFEDNYKEYIGKFEALDFDMTFAFDLSIKGFESSIAIINVDVPELYAVKGDQNDYLSSYHEEWNLIDADKESQENFRSNSLEQAICFLNNNGGSVEVVSSEIIKFQNDSNVEMVKIVLNSSPDEHYDLESVITMFSTVVNGELFVFWYRDFYITDVEEDTTCSEIIGSLEFYEVDREDILFLEPEMFVKTTIITILLSIVVLIITIFRWIYKRRAKFNAAEAQFEVSNKNEEKIGIDFDSIEVIKEDSEPPNGPIQINNEK